MQPHHPPVNRVLRQAIRQRGRGDGTAEQVPLRGVAIAAAEERELLLGFDALGDDTQLQRAGDADDGGYDGGGAVARGQVADEGAVDLYGRDGETLQIVER